MNKQISISAFFPTHNEQDNIESLVLKTQKVLSSITDQYEIIIVNDGSKDNTRTIAEALAKKNPNIKVINHEVNKGYGGAVKSGLYGAKNDWIFFTDGDGQFDVNEIPELLKYKDQYDIVVGYRIKRQDPWHRKLNAWCWGTLVNLLFGFHIRDVDCAFKLLKKKVVENFQLDANGAMISTELLARAKKAGFTIGETGVHHYARLAGKQTGAHIKVILCAFKELFKLYHKLR